MVKLDMNKKFRN